MAGEQAAARAGEHVAEGIVASAAKSVLRDAVGPGAHAAARDVARDAATHAPAAALSDAERTAARDALRSAHGAWNSTPEDFAREFPELAHATNPRYASGLPEYTQNCQSCVIAVDRSLDGAASSAVPRLLNDGRTAFLPDSRFAWPSSVERSVGGGNRVHAVGGYDEIAHEMIRAGDGARGVVHGMRLDGAGNYLSGHVFNIVNKGGTLHFVDGQENGYWRHELFQGYQFLRTR